MLIAKAYKRPCKAPPVVLLLLLLVGSYMVMGDGPWVMGIEPMSGTG